MELHTTIESLTGRLQSDPFPRRPLGLVPTMGALHEGHLSLIRRARENCSTVVVSVFVNPLQFGLNEDLDSYPKRLSSDAALVEAAEADILFAPMSSDMYPEGELQVTVQAGGPLANIFEGSLRPGHFDGVATVVAKLFGIVGPERAYFGEKDWQQLAVIRRMVEDLSMPVEIVGCPTVRDPDGLALSSRNEYLSEPQRRAAASISRALFGAAEMILNGERRADKVRSALRDLMQSELVEPVYADVINGAFEVPELLDAGEYRLLASAKVGPARLLDNVGVVISPSPTEVLS